MALLGAAAANEIGLISTSSSASTSLNEVGNLFGKVFGLLLPIMGFTAMNISKGKFQVDINPIMMMALAFMVDLYYLASVFVTMFQLQIKSFLDLFMM
ncbi:hypothetical protein L195_g045932, partial [Trifolium pratense]